MESSAQRFDRLAAALEQLVEDEAARIAAADYVGVVDVQRRAEPVLVALAKLTSHVSAKDARARISSVLQQRERNLATLNERLEAKQAELSALRQSVQRAAKIAPVYGRVLRDTGPKQLRKFG